MTPATISISIFSPGILVLKNLFYCRIYPLFLCWQTWPRLFFIIYHFWPFFGPKIRCFRLVRIFFYHAFHLFHIPFPTGIFHTALYSKSSSNLSFFFWNEFLKIQFFWDGQNEIETRKTKFERQSSKSGLT